MKNRLFVPNNKDQIKTIVKYGFNSFVLPFENFCVGFNTCFNLSEIKELSEKHDIYLIINKLFHYNEIESIISLLSSLENIKGFIIEDLGLASNLKNKNVILFQNHLNMNYDAINAFYELGIKSIVVSNELTLNEINEIRKQTASTLYYFIISKNNIMYSRRRLLTNYNSHFNKKTDDDNKIITEVVSNHELLVSETENGTSILNNTIFSGYSNLKDLENDIDYLVYNFSYIDENITKIILENIDSKDLNKNIEMDDYFLHNEVSYKVKEGI
jgi:collagenase-like PrtC family protease